MKILKNNALTVLALIVKVYFEASQPAFRKPRFKESPATEAPREYIDPCQSVHLFGLLWSALGLISFLRCGMAIITP